MSRVGRGGCAAVVVDVVVDVVVVVVVVVVVDVRRNLRPATLQRMMDRPCR